MKVIFAPAARAEFAEATRRYAVEAGRFHAANFRNEVHHTLALLGDHPAMGTPAASNTRRMVIHRYPYPSYTELIPIRCASWPWRTIGADPDIGANGDKVFSTFG